MSPFGVASALRAFKIPVREVTPIKQEEEGNITITDEWHVQVGETYMCLVQLLPRNKFKFYPVTTDLNSLITDIKRRVKIP